MASVPDQVELAAAAAPVTIGPPLRVADVERVAVARAPVALAPEALERVAANRAALEAAMARPEPIYGVTTGFGALAGTSVSLEESRRMQVNLLRSHAAGVGEELAAEVVRGALLIRLASLAMAQSGVRPLVLEHIAALLNSEFVPSVPRTGSLGASGDLAPSAHAFLPLIGEGSVRDGEGCALSGAEALARLGLEPLVLEPKEALALINGTHVMCAIGALIVPRVAALLDTLDAAAAVSIDALRGAAPAFDARVAQLRPLGGQAASAARVRALIDGSRRIAAAPEPGRVQDPYSSRCVPQIHGAAREGARFFGELVDVDLNAVTDNPLVFDSAEVVSAGNFHGQSLALAFDVLRLALADAGAVSERRVFRLVSPSARTHLPPFLTHEPGVGSGYMIVQYTAAALVSELRALAHPVSVDSVSTSDNQEDHVSMGMTAALMALDAVERAERIAGIELLCAAEALDCDPGDAPAPAVARIHALVRERIAPLREDRSPAPDIAAAAALVRSRAVAALAAGHEKGS